MRIFICVFCIVAGLATHAAAQDTKSIRALGVVFNLAAPNGFCFLDEHIDRELLEIQRSLQPAQALGLAYFYTCAEIKNVRAGRADLISLNAPYGAYVVLQDPKNKYLHTSRTSYLQRLERVMREADQSEFQRNLKKQLNNMTDSTELSSIGFEFEQVVSLGVLGSDRNAVYIGFIFKAGDESETHFMATVSAMSLINGTRIGTGVSTEYRTGSTFDNLMLTAKNLARRLVNSNIN